MKGDTAKPRGLLFMDIENLPSLGDSTSLKRGKMFCHSEEEYNKDEESCVFRHFEGVCD